MDEIESLQKEVAKLKAKVNIIAIISISTSISIIQCCQIDHCKPGREDNNSNRPLWLLARHWNRKSSSGPWCHRWGAFSFLPIFTHKVSDSELRRNKFIDLFSIEVDPKPINKRHRRTISNHCGTSGIHSNVGSTGVRQLWINDIDENDNADINVIVF